MTARKAPAKKVAAPVLREVRVLPHIPERKRNEEAIAAGLPKEGPPEGYLRVFAKSNVLGLAANHWGDVPTDMHHLEECLRRGLVLLEDGQGRPAPAKLPPRRCAGCGGGQH